MSHELRWHFSWLLALTLLSWNSRSASSAHAAQLQVFCQICKTQCINACQCKSVRMYVNSMCIHEYQCTVYQSISVYAFTTFQKGRMSSDNPELPATPARLLRLKNFWRIWNPRGSENEHLNHASPDLPPKKYLPSLIKQQLHQLWSVLPKKESPNTGDIDCCYAKII